MRRLAGAGLMRRLDLRPAPPLVLDVAGMTVRAAWSMHSKLLRGYAGPLFRVRRSSDNVEQDIYALQSSDQVDLVALAAFCSGTNGFVRTKYDQSGAARDIGNATAAAQPKVYDSATGPLLGATGHLVSRYDGSNDRLIRADGLGWTGSPAFTTAFSCRLAAATGSRSICYFGPDSPFAATLAFSVRTSTLRVVAFTGDGTRQFTPAVTPATGSYYLCARPSNVQAQNVPFRQNGIDLVQLALSLGPSVVNLTNSNYGEGDAGATSVAAYNGDIDTVIHLDGEATAAQIAVLEGFMAQRHA